MADTVSDMAATSGRGKRAPAEPAAAEEPRHVYGPRPLAALLPGVTRAALRGRHAAATTLRLDWAGIVGPQLAGETAPLRLASGTLTIACSGPIALELQHLSTALSERVNRHLGRDAVQRLRFVQMPPAAVPAPAPAIGAKRDLAAADARAAEAVAALPDGPLRDALLALGRAVLAEQPPPRRNARRPHTA